MARRIKLAPSETSRISGYGEEPAAAVQMVTKNYLGWQKSFPGRKIARTMSFLSSDGRGRFVAYIVVEFHLQPRRT